MQSAEIKSEKRRRLGNQRYFPLLVAGLLAVCGWAGAETGYLPKLGPAPLRFMRIPLIVTNAFILPEPDEYEPVATVASPVPFGPMPEAQPVKPADPGSVDYGASSGAPQDTTRPEDVVSPQMLLQFFNKSTNGPANSVVAPVEFTPPKTPEPPSSKATYSTGP